MRRDRRPNVLLVLTDQQRSTAMGCAGVERVATPHLDRLAGQGTRFANAVANTPACAPSRATILTGQHVLSHGVVQNELSLGHEHPTLGTCLTAAGYRCGYIGKLHVDGRGRGANIPPGPRRLGFDDTWAGTECNHNYFAGYYYDEQTREPVWFDGYEPDGQTDLAIDFLDRQRGAPDPFCLVVSWSPPHCPYGMVPQRYKDLYPPGAIDLLPNARDAVVEKLPDATPEEHDRRKKEVIGGYYAHVTALDACMGRLLDSLDANGLAEDTLVVFTSDHGDMLFSQNRGWKCKPWRESVGVPLLVRWPGRVPAGRVTRGPIGLVDLTPSLLGLTGTPVPGAMEGADLGAFVCGEEEAAPESAYINFPCMDGRWNMPGWRGVVTKTHTYAATSEGPWLLYDDLIDPFQLRNLTQDPASSDMVGHLDGLTRDWLAQTRDDFAPPSVVAERFIGPDHFMNTVPDPPPLEPAISEGQRARAGRRIPNHP